MNNLNKIVLASILALSSVSSNAEFIKGDWKNAGDNLSVVDSESGIEWLNLNQTIGMSIGTAQGLLDTTFAGWRLPSQDEVATMMTNISGFDFSGEAYKTWYGHTSLYENVAREMTLALGATKISSEKTFSAGLSLSNDGSSALKNEALYDHVSTTYGQLNINRNPIPVSYASSYMGVYLVSDGGTTLSSLADPSINANNPNSSVPLPATLGLLH